MIVIKEKRKRITSVSLERKKTKVRNGGERDQNAVPGVEEALSEDGGVGHAVRFRFLC